MVSIEGVQQTPAVLASGQDSEREHEGYIGVWGVDKGLAEGGGLVNEICFSWCFNQQERKYFVPAQNTSHIRADILNHTYFETNPEYKFEAEDLKSLQ